MFSIQDKRIHCKTFPSELLYIFFPPNLVQMKIHNLADSITECVLDLLYYEQINNTMCSINTCTDKLHGNPTICVLARVLFVCNFFFFVFFF